MTRSSLGLLRVIFYTFVPDLWLLIYAKIFVFRSIEQIDRFSQNFIYTLILTRSSLELLHTIFCTFVLELWPLIYAKIRFRSICLEQTDRFSPNFIYAFILTKSKFGLLHIIFKTFELEFWPVIYARILFPLNILRTNWQLFIKFYILVKSSNRPHIFLQIFGKAIRTISISFAFLNRSAYQSSITENG